MLQSRFESCYFDLTVCMIVFVCVVYLRLTQITYFIIRCRMLIFDRTASPKTPLFLYQICSSHVSFQQNANSFVRISASELLQRLSLSPIVVYVSQRQLRWTGRVMRGIVFPERSFHSGYGQRDLRLPKSKLWSIFKETFEKKLMLALKTGLFCLLIVMVGEMLLITSFYI